MIDYELTHDAAWCHSEEPPPRFTFIWWESLTEVLYVHALFRIAKKPPGADTSRPWAEEGTEDDD